jgi:hypothetical protein
VCIGCGPFGGGAAGGGHAVVDVFGVGGGVVAECALGCARGVRVGACGGVGVVARVVWFLRLWCVAVGARSCADRALVFLFFFFFEGSGGSLFLLFFFSSNLAPEIRTPRPLVACGRALLRVIFFCFFVLYSVVPLFSFLSPFPLRQRKNNEATQSRPKAAHPRGGILSDFQGAEGDIVQKKGGGVLRF